MMNVNEKPMDEDDDQISDADDDAELDDEVVPTPQSGVASQAPSLPGRSANIGHNSTNTTVK